MNTPDGKYFTVHCDADAKFIAESRTLVPALADALEAALHEVEVLQRALLYAAQDAMTMSSNPITSGPYYKCPEYIKYGTMSCGCESIADVAEHWGRYWTAQARRELEGEGKKGAKADE